MDKLETINGVEFDVIKIVNYLKRYKNDLEFYWTRMSGNLDIAILRQENIKGLDSFENKNRFEQEILLKDALERELLESLEIDKVKFEKLCLWIIKTWGGITTGNDKGTIEAVQEFIRKGNEHPKFERVASTSKVASFLYPKQDIIYDSRVAYSLNWILLSISASDKFFPIPEGRNSKMMAFDLNVLIRIHNIEKYKAINIDNLENRLFINNIDKTLYIKQDKAYSTLRQLIKAINKELWKGDEERKDNLYYTEMLLFAIADREIYQEITQKITLNMN